MIKHCKKVLRRLRNLSNHSDAIMAFLGDTDRIYLRDDVKKFYDCSKYQNEIESTLKHLCEEGYLEYVHNEHYFVLTTKGLHPYRF